MPGKPQPLKDADYRIGGTPLIRKVGRRPLTDTFGRPVINRAIPIVSPQQSNSIARNLNPPTQQIVPNSVNPGFAGGPVATAGASESSGPIPIPVPPGTLAGPVPTNPNFQKIADSHSTDGIIAAGVSTTFLNIPGISFYLATLVGAGTNGILARVYKQGQPSSQIKFFQATGMRYGKIVFDAVELTNMAANGQVTFTIVVGGGVPTFSYDEYLDHRASPSANALTVVTDPTTAVAFKTRTPAWNDSLAGNASQAIADGFQGKNRASLYISNLDTASTLQLWDANNNTISSIQPQVTYQFNLNGTVTLHNPTGAAINCNIGETYYN